MKKVKVLERKGTQNAHSKLKYENATQENDNSSIGHMAVFVFPNRWGVEMSRSVITSGSQSTTTAVIADSDFGKESFLNQISASQTGLSRFQETRLLSSTTLKRRALEARERAEKRRKELLRQEADTDNEI